MSGTPRHEQHGQADEHAADERASMPVCDEERGPGVDEEDRECDRSLQAQHGGGGCELLAAQKHDDRAGGHDHRQRQEAAAEQRHLRRVRST